MNYIPNHGVQYMLDSTYYIPCRTIEFKSLQKSYANPDKLAKVIVS